MKRDAVIGHTFAVALATAAVSAAFCAAPAHADELGKVALAPLPEVMAQGTLFPKKAATTAKPDPQKSKVALRDSDHEGSGGGDPAEEGHVTFRDNPNAYIVNKGFTLRNVMPNHPSGFPADSYQYLFNPTYGFGSGEIGLSYVQAEGRGHNLPSENFFGISAQQRLIKEGHGFMPTVSLGAQANVGPDDHNTLNGWLVASKRVLGHESKKKGGSSFPGLWLTGGYRYGSYDTHDLRVIGRLVREGEGPSEEVKAGRPFGGINLALNKHLFASAEVQQRMAFERNNPYCVKGTLIVTHGFGFEGGIRNVGFISHGFIGFVYGNVGGLRH